MGKKLDSSVKKDLRDIDRSSTDGDIRYISLSLSNKNLVYKQLLLDGYITNGIGAVEKIYLGFTENNEVRKITIVYLENSFYW
ncbi:MAG: hypothetical protein M3Z26_04605 [Bacteroidota bacterium]|nr:hypothetical protein [Bacteroidota bacterium]